MRSGSRGLYGLVQHPASARGVHSKHVDTEFSGSFYRTGHSIGNVVKLEIEKYLPAGAHQLRHDFRALRGKQLESDLIERDALSELVDDFLRIHGSGDVERDDQVLFRGDHEPIVARKGDVYRGTFSIATSDAAAGGVVTTSSRTLASPWPLMWRTRAAL